MPDPKTYDLTEKEITVGARVSAGSEPDERWEGTVTAISEPEIDVDDEGRNLYLCPKVTVKWDDAADTEDLTSHVLFAGDEFEPPSFECDELEVI